MTWFEICQLLVLFPLSFLATWVGIVDIPNSPADMGDPPDLWGQP